ncbi:hypothetical protein RB653_002421 [Dictyostelium firmibasis]|uniref:FNIP repeat-containing protein n=1 Tax=Dictyostelium firmibasis TaxID=79012 RepID=A0AAN7TYC6_9MYCE
MDNNELFFKVWRNIIIQNEIFFHLKLYNKHINKRFLFNINEISKYRYKSYLNSIKIKVFNDDNEHDDDDDDYDDQNNDKVENLQFIPLPYGIVDIKFHYHKNLILSKIGSSTIPTSVHTIKFSNNIKLDISNVLPKFLTSIKFGKLFNEIIPKHVIPNSVKTIIFGYRFNKPLEEGVLPSSLTSIEFGNTFNQSLNGNWLPANLKSLKFGKEFNHPIEGIDYLQKSLTTLILPIDYKSEIKFKMVAASPQTLSSSSSSLNGNFEYIYNSFSNSIPNSITKLKLDNLFNQPLKPDLLPNSITSIIFGKYYNTFIPKKINSLSNLSSIEFGHYFNKSFNFKTLVNLKTIKFGYSFIEPLINCKFPPNLTSLTFGFSFNNNIPIGYFINLPLKQLSFGGFFDKPIYDKTLPPTLISLDLGVSSYFDPGFCNSFNQLESLVIGKGCSRTFIKGELPLSLKEISFNNFFKQPIQEDVIPNGVTSLSFGYSYNKPIEKDVLPDSIKKLSFGFLFNQSIIKDILPINLTSLSFNYHFNQPIGKGVLPNSLTYLSFEGVFNQKFEVGSLPNNITNLSLCYFYDQPFSIGSLPTSLKELRIHSSKFNQDFSSSFGDYFTSSLETIYIGKSSKLINILDSNFFCKYIKFYDINKQ